MNVIRLTFVLFIIFGTQTILFAQKQANVAINRACYQSGAANYHNTAHLITDGALSKGWISNPADEAWFYVDLGAVTSISQLDLVWNAPNKYQYAIEIATTSQNWQPLVCNPVTNGNTTTVRFKTVQARYIKFKGVSRGAEASYILNEFKVLGSPVKVAKPMAQAALHPEKATYLTNGNWKLQRASFVAESGEVLSNAGYSDQSWLPATVPGTILVSYLNNGAIPDMYYADQQLMVSDSFFTADFWYRNSFFIPETYQNQQVWLNFDGINYKADIYFNGQFIAKTQGAFVHTKLNITPYVKLKAQNYLAVLVHKNDHPGEVTEQHLNDPDGNGGIIGLDGPTFLASIGWNWMPTIRGRNTGIWNDVFITASQQITIENPFIITDLNLPDTTVSDVAIQLTVQNHSSESQSGVLKGKLAGVEFSLPVTMASGERKLVTLSKQQFPQLSIHNPKLWWPNGYGAQNIDTFHVEFLVDNQISDLKTVPFGFRKYTYLYNHNNLELFVNGSQVMVRGGNWGMPDAMMRFTKADYDLRVKLHKDMNMNLIRNWIGMTADDEFYEACDKYGIMVWDDFWLANPVDGPVPLDNDLFIANAKDKVLHLRNHPSIVFWVGRNEGYPPVALDSALLAIVNEHDFTRHYISSSAHAPVTGFGPYEIKDPVWYYQNRGTTLHSELGIVCVPSAESFKQMMPEQYWWPANDMWGKHDWTQQRVKIYTNDLNHAYGESQSIDEFCRKAQMLNMEGSKAMMETWQANRGSGVVLWMSHPAWPSLICQTYDYYLEPTAAFFGVKKGCEPIHILWRADNNKVLVANNNLTHLQDAMVKATILSLDGKVVWEKTMEANVMSNSATELFELDFEKASGKVHFIKLELVSQSGVLLSDNFYWHSNEYQNYTDLNTMNKASLVARATKTENGKTSQIEVELDNQSSEVALMARLILVQKKSGKRVLPVSYSDNYISLIPGETKKVSIEFDVQNLESDEPQLLLEGWNITKTPILIK